MRFFVGILIFVLSSAHASAETVKARHSSIRLISSVQKINLSDSFQLAVQFKMDPHWHTYWVNPGDSGAPAQIRLSVPDGFAVQDIRWPYPERFMESELVTYGYEGTVNVIVAVKSLGKAQDLQDFSVQADLQWLVCHEICVPEEAKVTLTLPVTDASSVKNPEWKKVERWVIKNMPLPAPWEGVIREDNDIFLFDLPKKNLSQEFKSAEFFPLQSQVIQNEFSQKIEENQEAYVLRLKKSAHLAENPAQLDGVLVLEDLKEKKSYHVQFPIQTDQ